MAEFERLVVKKPWYTGTLVRPVCRACGWEGPICGDLADVSREEAVHRGRCRPVEIAPWPGPWADVGSTRMGPNR